MIREKQSSAKKSAKDFLRQILKPIFFWKNSERFFHSDHYLRHNARRLEHLASLQIPVSGMSVLEVGAGIGDHSHFYIDRNCKITITEARKENLAVLRKRYPHQNVEFLDMEHPTEIEGAPFDVVHCYGLLYHLSNPEEALAFLSRNAKRILFLETCVSYGQEEAINLVAETQSDPTQATSGVGCRPTRSWLFGELKSLFEYVYIPVTQPFHNEFPVDWSATPEGSVSFQRAVFVASREKINNEMLVSHLMRQQARCVSKDNG